MSTQIDRKTADLVFDKLVTLFSHFFPGIVIMELFFGFGLFSSVPDNIYSFLIYSIWAGILSIPYNFMHHPALENFEDHLEMEWCKKYNLDRNIFDEEDENDISEQVELGFILIMLLITYVISKTISFFHFLSSEILGVSINIQHLIVSVLLTLCISYPLGKLYSSLLLKIVVYGTKHIFENTQKNNT